MPASSLEFTGYTAVASTIPGYLCSPILKSALWHAKMTWAGMPKTTIDKDGDSELSENKVGTAWQINVAPPTFDAVESEKSYHPEFGVPVPVTSNPRHYC